MESILQAIQLFAAVFVGSLAAAYGVTALKLRANKHFLKDLKMDTSVRVRGADGVYRCRFAGFSESGLRFTAPISRGSFVPIRVGENLVVEAPVQDRVVIFHTEIIARCPASHTFTVEKPDHPRVVNRREDPRSNRFEGVEASVNGEWAEVVDVSMRGARLLTIHNCSAGDVVRVSIPKIEANQLAWVVEVLPAPVGSRQGILLRLRFVDALPPIPIH